MIIPIYFVMSAGIEDTLTQNMIDLIRDRVVLSSAPGYVDEYPKGKIPLFLGDSHMGEEHQFLLLFSGTKSNEHMRLYFSACVDLDVEAYKQMAGYVITVDFNQYRNWSAIGDYPAADCIANIKKAIKILHEFIESPVYMLAVILDEDTTWREETEVEMRQTLNLSQNIKIVPANVSKADTYNMLLNLFKIQTYYGTDIAQAIIQYLEKRLAKLQ